MALAAERIGVRTTAVATVGAAVGGLRAIGEHAPLLPLAASTGLNAAMIGSTFFAAVELASFARGGQRDMYNGGLAGGLAGGAWTYAIAGGGPRRAVIGAVMYATVRPRLSVFLSRVAFFCQCCWCSAQTL